MAFLEGMLQVAQKLRRTNLSFRSGFSLSHLSIAKSGAALPRGDVSETGSARLSSEEVRFSGAAAFLGVPATWPAREFLNFASPAIASFSAAAAALGSYSSRFCASGSRYLIFTLDMPLS